MAQWPTLWALQSPCAGGEFQGVLFPVPICLYSDTQPAHDEPSVTVKLHPWELYQAGLLILQSLLKRFLLQKREALASGPWGNLLSSAGEEG